MADEGKARELLDLSGAGPIVNEPETLVAIRDKVAGAPCSFAAARIEYLRGHGRLEQMIGKPLVRSRLGLAAFGMCVSLGCSSGAGSDSAGDAASSGNWMKSDVAAEGFSATGGAVEVGSLGTNGTHASLTLSMYEDRGGHRHRVTSGLLSVDLAVGETRQAPAGAAYETRTPDGTLETSFAGEDYLLFYATGADDPEAKLRLVLTRVEEISTDATVKRVKLAGSFRFHAVKKPEPLSDECVTNAVRRGIEHEMPAYDAVLCGAEDRIVDATFEVEAVLPIAG